MLQQGYRQLSSVLVITLLALCAPVVFTGINAGQGTGNALFAQEDGAKEVDLPPNDSDAKAVTIIDRYLVAVGGRESLMGIKTKELRFTNKKFSPTGVTEMKMARFQKRDYKIREEWELPGMGLTKDGAPLEFLQVYDGDKGYVKAMGYVSELTGKTLTVFLWDKPIDDFFLQWAEDGYTAKYLGPTEIQGNAADGVEMVAYAGGQRVRNYFSVDTGLLLKKSWTEALGNGLTKKEVYFQEFVKIPHQDERSMWIRMATIEQVFEDGELSLEKNYERIIINGGLDDSRFLRPEGPDFDERAKDGRISPDSQPDSQPASQPDSKPNTKATTQPK